MSASQCSLCPNATAFTLPERQINISSLGFVSDCLSLSSLVPLLFASNSSECELLHSVSSLCGCPTRDDACRLCSDGSTAAYGSRELQFLSDMFNGIVPTCELVEAMLTSYSDNNGFCVATQLLLQEYCGCGAEIESEPISHDENSACKLCELGQVPNPDKVIEIEGFPLKTCGQLEMATQTLFTISSIYCPTARILYIHCGCQDRNKIPCPICGVTQSYEVPLPDKILDPMFTGAILPAIPISCKVLKDIAYGFPSREEIPSLGAGCAAVQGVATECGCPKPEKPDTCRMCAEALQPEYYDYRPVTLEGYTQATCRTIEIITPFLRDNDMASYGGAELTLDCRFMQSVGYFCGCNNGVFTYWGADTLSKQIAVQWIQRIAAIFSFFGSSAIIIRILTSKRSSQTRMYFQIMIALSCADMLSSIAWGLGSLPTTYDLNSLFGNLEMFGDKANDLQFYGSYGNTATCKAQGFLLQVGFISILYNMSLSYYYKLCVVDSYRESQFNAYYKALLLCAPAVIGLIVASASIPFITFTPVGCTIGSFKDKGGWAKMILLFYLPYGPAFLFIPLNNIYVFRKIRTQRKRGDRWSFVLANQSSPGSDALLNKNENKVRSLVKKIKRIGNREEQNQSARKSTAISQLESKVFWQSLWYFLAFLASYSIFFVFFAVDGYQFNSYSFYVALSLMAPLQGFFNFLIFNRSIILSIFSAWKNWLSNLSLSCCFPIIFQRNAPCNECHLNQGTHSELVHPDIADANFNASKSGESKHDSLVSEKRSRKSMYSNYEIQLQPIELLDQAQQNELGEETTFIRNENDTKISPHQGSCSSDLKNCNDNHEIATSLQLQKIELIDDFQGLSTDHISNGNDSERMIHDSSALDACNMHIHDPTSSSEMNTKAFNQGKDLPPAFSSVIEFEDSDLELNEDKHAGFWSNAFGMENKSMATKEIDNSLIQSHPSNLPISGKDYGFFPSKGFPMQGAKRDPNLSANLKGREGNLEHCKSSTVSSVLEFDVDDNKKGKESNWWKQVFHR